VVKKIWGVMLLALLLASILAIGVSAEMHYSEVPNDLTYADLKASLVDPYEGAYCYMEKYGILTFCYPKEVPTGYVEVLEVCCFESESIVPYCDPFFYGHESDGILCSLTSGYCASKYISIGFLMPDDLSSTRRFVVTEPYVALNITKVAKELSDPWQPFSDVDDVPSEAPPFDPSSSSFIPVLGEIIAIVVGGISGIAANVGSGLSSLARNIFLTGSGETLALSTFGAVVIIFAGVSLAIGLLKWVVSWITSLGSSG